MTHSLRLRTILLLCAGGLFLVALVTSIAVMVLTRVIHEQASDIITAEARIRSSLRARVALLTYARASDLAASERSLDSFEQQAQAEQRLRSEVSHLGQLATPDRVQQLDHLLRKVDTYIQLRHQFADQRLPIGETLRRSTPALDATFVDLRQVISADDEWVESLESSSRRWDAAARGLGVSAAGLLILGFTAALLGTRALIYRPLVGITAAIHRFAGGQRTTRAPVAGAVEIRQTAQTFNDMADRLGHQERERFTFLAGVAHDLRNPLAALKLAVRPRPADAAPEVMALVRRQVDRLERMISDLLDATRIEAGQLSLQRTRIDLRALAEHVAALYREVSPAHEVGVLSAARPLSIDCDATRIEQVLGNLVSNAIKYSPEGGLITITAFADGDDAVLSVSDQGFGIGDDERSRIFEPFHRSAPTTNIPGAGLGLSVAKKIVQAHGGTIEVESRVGIGSTFSVRLPGLHAEQHPLH